MFADGSRLHVCIVLSQDVQKKAENVNTGQLAEFNSAVLKAEFIHLLRHKPAYRAPMLLRLCSELKQIPLGPPGGDLQNTSTHPES